MKKKNLLTTLFLAAALAGALALAGCAGQSPEEAIEADIAAQLDPIQNAEQAAIDELSGMVDSSIDMSVYGIESAEYVKSLLSGFRYEVKDVVVDGDSATATVDVTCKSFTDASTRVEELSADFAENLSASPTLSADDLAHKAGQLMMQAMDETEPKTTECAFAYEKSGGSWTLSSEAEQEISRAFFA